MFSKFLSLILPLGAMVTILAAVPAFASWILAAANHSNHITQHAHLAIYLGIGVALMWIGFLVVFVVSLCLEEINGVLGDASSTTRENY